MANAYINIYKDNPTAGGVDGTAVSLGNSFTAPIHFDLDAEQNESKTLNCAIRTESGYTASNVTIQDLNDSNDRYKLSLDGENFADSIELSSVSSINSIFYVQASSEDTEQPQTDRSVKLRYHGKLRRVQS